MPSIRTLAPKPCRFKDGAVTRAHLSPMQRTLKIIAAWCALALAPSTLVAAADTAATSRPAAVQTAITHHTATIGGRTLTYTATASTIAITNAKDETLATMFYVAYTAEKLGPSARRPLTFAYNGGPGGSSALIHLGAFGPRTVVTTNAAATAPPPYGMTDNTDSLLDTSDLVFVDAIGTGFSRLSGAGTAKDFYSIDGDSHAFAQFIRKYITLNNRWNSAKYLAGESYGTTRSVVLADMLQNDGIVLSGITLISTVLDFATLESAPGNDEPYWLYLPSEAAVAAYHQRLPAEPSDLPAFLRSVRAFAQGPYLQALSKGSTLMPSERDVIAEQMHAYTGLSVDYLVRSNLRVEPERFEKQLLGDSGQSVGRYDARFREFDLDPLADSADRDASADAIFGAFTASFNRYVREELHYTTDAAYIFLSEDVNGHWQWSRGEHSRPTGVNVVRDLRDAMTANPYLRVFSANGIYDLATPFFATEYSLAHAGVNPALQAHISYGFYPAGHMIYLNPVAHAELKTDLIKFYH